MEISASIPQSGIFHTGAPDHSYLEFTAPPDFDAEHFKAAYCRLRDHLKTLESRDIRAVAAFRPGLWQRLTARETPAKSDDFTPLTGWDGHQAPATQRDFWLWLQGTGRGDLFDAAQSAVRTFTGVMTVALEVSGFSYHTNQDLTGFVDGTANPKGLEAREVALIPVGEEGAGGAYILTQKWLHDLDHFLGLPVEEQEKIIGRTKVENVELEGDDLPPDAHIARVDYKLDGVAQKLFRRSIPFGDTREAGLYFVAFANDPQRFRILLDRMFGTSGDGGHDRLTAFSRPVTGAYWFAPSEAALDQFCSAGKTAPNS